jgi:NitT/TauT family transport system substrate-binding protein
VKIPNATKLPDARNSIASSAQHGYRLASMAGATLTNSRLSNCVYLACRKNYDFEQQMKIILNSLALLLITVAVSAASDKTVIRVGHFPNITHVQGLIAHNLSRQGKGWFEARLGPSVEIQWFTYNAGPSAMEAIFAKSIELTYVGPGPALNAHAKSQGEEIRIIAGSANGGAALVVQPDANLKAPADFKGKKIATPQLGNTQDISCRAWLTSGGLRITQLGGRQ